MTGSEEGWEHGFLKLVHLAVMVWNTKETPVGVGLLRFFPPMIPSALYIMLPTIRAGAMQQLIHNENSGKTLGFCKTFFSEIEIEKTIFFSSSLSPSVKISWYAVYVFNTRKPKNPASAVE